MSTTTSKDELVQIIENERAQWDALVATATPEQMTSVPLTEDWTFRDLAAHLLAWREWGLERLEAAADNLPRPNPPYPPALESDDDINAWFHQRDLDRSALDVTSAFSSSFDRLKQIVANLSDAALSEPARFPYLDGEAIGPIIADGRFFEHIHEEHGPDIEVWRRRIQTA